MKIIIVGCGKVGYTLVEQLGSEDHDIVVIDEKPEKVSTITNNLDAMGIVGNGINHQTLIDAGITTADLLIAVTGDDEKNLLCCVIARKTGHCQTIARVRNPIYNKEIEFLKKEFGLAMIINPELAAANEIARIFQFPSAIRVDTFAKGHVELLHFKVTKGSPLIALKLFNLHQTLHSNVLVCTVIRGDKVIIPNGDFEFQENDVVAIASERRNAIDPETSAMMEQILNDAEQNPEVGAIIITGTGDRSFCSGEDLAAYDENGTCQTIMAHGFAGITERLSAKPIICAANGTAVAGGLEIALACDIIVASENARFGLSEVKVGFLATSGGLIRLPNIIPKKIASEMVLTGKLIDAQRAYEVGLVNYVVPREQVMDKAMELAEIIAANAPISLKLSKEIFLVATQCSFEDAQRYCNRCWDYIEKTEDAVEGPKAFLEKRKPDWKGR